MSSSECSVGSQHQVRIPQDRDSQAGKQTGDLGNGRQTRRLSFSEAEVGSDVDPQEIQNFGRYDQVYLLSLRRIQRIDAAC